MVGILFLYAGIAKVRDPAGFATIIANMQLGIPSRFVAVIALALPAFEILLGIYLLGGWLLWATSIAATSLLAVYIVALSTVVLRGISAPCGCFGTAGTEPTTWWTVARDGAAIIPAIYLVWWTQSKKLARPWA